MNLQNFDMLQLYSYFRSSASYRVRIALNYKNLRYALQPIHLLRDGGEQLQENYRQINPQSLVPALVDQGKVITQSIAIMEYLDEVYPEPALMPKDPLGRAHVRMLSQVIACDIHPLNNLRVLKYLTETLKISEDEKQLWYKHWINQGFAALEQLLGTEKETGKFCYGDSPTMADMCLIPQVYNAERFHCSLEAYPMIQEIYSHCIKLSFFQEAHPDRQRDAV